MKTNDIKNLLLEKISRYKSNIFDKLSVEDLCDIMDFCEKKFKTDKNNWSVKLFEKFCYENDNFVLGPHLILRDFHSKYTKRKKPNKTFYDFLERLRHYSYVKGIMKPIDNQMKLRDKKKLKEFIKHMILIKTKFLTGSNEMMYELISKKINTGRTISQLKKLNYQ